MHLTHLLIVRHSVIRQYDHSHWNHSRFITHRRLGVNKPVLRHGLEITGYAYACKQNGTASTRIVETLRRGAPSQHMCLCSGSPCDRPHRNRSARASGRPKPPDTNLQKPVHFRNTLAHGNTTAMHGAASSPSQHGGHPIQAPFCPHSTCTRQQAEYNLLIDPAAV